MEYSRIHRETGTKIGQQLGHSTGGAPAGVALSGNPNGVWSYGDLGLLALTFLRRFERDTEVQRRKATLSFHQDAPSLHLLRRELAELEAQTLRSEFDKSLERQKTKVVLHLRWPARRENDILQYLEQIPAITRLQVESLD